MYALFFLLSLTSLTLWFYHKDHEGRANLMQKLFYLAVTLFGVSWFFAEGEFGYKLVVLGRELIVLGVAPFVLGLFRRIKWAFFTMLALSVILLQRFYFDELSHTFPQKSPFPTLPKERPELLDQQGEILIEVKEGSQLADIQLVLDKFKLEARPAFYPKDQDFTDLDDYYVINVPADFENKLPMVFASLEAVKAIESVEGNEQISIAPIEAQRPSPRLGKKYGLNDPGIDLQWGFEAMKVADLYQVTKDVKPVKKALVAILDTGIDGNHEDLKDNFTSTQAKYDTDVAGHGTHCAGIAAAVSNNGRGVASFSQNNQFVRVTSIKVLSDNGFGTQQMIINGMLEAADAGADVVSLSLGGLSSDSKQRAYQKAVDYVNRKGGIVVVAAGNSNRDAKDFAPACAPGVIAVSAVDTLMQRASFSNHVQNLKMGLAAPGVKIYSTFPGGQYQTFNGTSMATPYVAGLLGVMKSIRPSLSTREAFDILKKSGIDTKNPNQTGKLIQPGAALKELL